MKILLVGDEHEAGMLVKTALEQQGFNVVHCHSGGNGTKYRYKEFDLAVIFTPDQANSLELCRTLKKAKPAIFVIIVSAHHTIDDKIEAFIAGADDYLVKPFDFRELLFRIRALLNRQSAAERKTCTSCLSYDDLEMNVSSRTVKRAGREIHLTPKEFKLLEYMMRNPERVLSRIEIADKVWDTQFDTGTNFIDVYINYLRKKIDKSFERKLIHTKPRIGFTLKSDYQ